MLTDSCNTSGARVTYRDVPYLMFSAFVSTVDVHIKEYTWIWLHKIGTVHVLGRRRYTLFYVCHPKKSFAVETTRPQKKRATAEYLEKRSGVRNGSSRIQVQLHGGRWRRRVKKELDGEKWSVAYAAQGISQVGLSQFIPISLGVTRAAIRFYSRNKFIVNWILIFVIYIYIYIYIYINIRFLISPYLWD